ncbi:hypothetical protein F4803DRAFT_197352 [Xylaria telfairii]|nr:hypothetical protein F4803DRAFT_197352 [Xylaria telfairii]
MTSPDLKRALSWGKANNGVTRSPPNSPRVSAPRFPTTHTRTTLPLETTQVHTQLETIKGGLRLIISRSSASTRNRAKPEPPSQQPPRLGSNRMGASHRHTCRQLALEAATKLDEIQPDVCDLWKIIERTMNTSEESVQTAVKSLKELVEDSRRLSSQMKAISVSPNESLEPLTAPLQASRNTMHAIRNIIHDWKRIQPRDLPWGDGTVKEWEKTIRLLYKLDGQIQESDSQFTDHVLKFFETYVEDIELELCQLRSTSTRGYSTTNTDPVVRISAHPKPPIQQSIRRISELSRHSWKQYKDVPGAYLRRHEFYESVRRHSTGMWLIKDPAFGAWLKGRNQNILWCRGKSGTGKSVLASRVIESLKRNEKPYAYFYLGSGKVQYASGIILALLEQSCELTGIIPPSLRNMRPAEQCVVDESLVSEDINAILSEDLADQAPEDREPHALTSITNPDTCQGVTDSEQHIGMRNSRNETNSWSRELRAIEQLSEVTDISVPLPNAGPDQNSGETSSPMPIFESYGVYSDSHDRESLAILHKPTSSSDIEIGTRHHSSNVPDVRLVRPNLDTLLGALRESCSSKTFSSSHLFIVLDGWDEDNMDIVADFQRIIETLSACSCKIYISSRLNKAFTATSASFIDIDQGKFEHQEDIYNYIQRKLRSGLCSPPDKKIESSIAEVAVEIFLASSIVFNVASLITRTILRSPNRGEYIEKLVKEHVSDRLSEEVIYHLLSPKNNLIDMNHDARAIIIYLLSSDCPLSFEALKVSLLGIPNHERLLLQLDDEEEQLVSREELDDALRACEPFVEIDPGNKLVRLNVAVNNRSTVIEFWPRDVQNVYCNIIKSALAVIRKQQAQHGIPEVEAQIVDMLRTQPNLEFSATWPAYVRRLASLGMKGFGDAKEAIDRVLDNPECLLFALQINLYAKGEYRQHGMTWNEFNMWIKSMTKLQIIAKWGFTWAVQRVLEEMPDVVSKCDLRSSTALHEAGKGGFADIIKILLARNLPVDSLDVDGKTALEYAFENGDKDTLIHLFQAHVTRSTKSQIGLIPAEIILAYCKARSSVQDGSGDSRLQELEVLRTIREDDEQQARVLSFMLAAGTDPNCETDEGEPAIYLAVKYRKIKMLTTLLENNASVSAKTRNESKESALHFAARLGLSNTVKLLLKFEADVNSLDRSGRTPLFATLNGSEGNEMNTIINMVVSRGADVDHADCKQQRPLHVAARKGLITPIRLFQFLAKERSPKDYKGYTPLDYARENKHRELEFFLSE